MKFFTKMSLNSKIILVAIFLALDAIIITAVAYVGMEKINSEFLIISNKSIPNIEKVSEMDLSFRSTRIHLRTLGLAGLSQQQMSSAIESVSNQMAIFEKNMMDYDLIDSTPEEQKLVQNLKNNWILFRKIGENVIANSKDGSPEKIVLNSQIFLTDCPDAAEKMIQDFKALNEYQTKKSSLYKENAISMTADVKKLSVILTLIGMSLGLFLAFVISRQISKALSEIAKTLQVSATEVSSASSQIAATSTELSQSTSEQAASLEQTVASVEQMTSIVRKNSENAEISSATANSTQEKVNQGKQSVAHVISAIQQISDSNQAISNQIDISNQKMNEIVSLIQEIEQKTKVINEIVFQTKLLSFNASVEAARAGEHGKGFAVVAEEVGNLAAMSGNAAKDISQLLDNSVGKVKNIADDTKQSVGNLVHKGQNTLQTGMQVAEECRQILDTIVLEIQRVSKMAGEIAEASEEQSQGITEINKAMNQLDQVTQVNATATEQASSAAEHLSTQAQQLKMVTETLIKTVDGEKMAS